MDILIIQRGLRFTLNAACSHLPRPLCWNPARVAYWNGSSLVGRHVLLRWEVVLVRMEVVVEAGLEQPFHALPLHTRVRVALQLGLSTKIPPRVVHPAHLPDRGPVLLPFPEPFRRIALHIPFTTNRSVRTPDLAGTGLLDLPQAVLGGWGRWRDG